MGWKLALSKKMLTEIVQISVDSNKGAGRRDRYREYYHDEQNKMLEMRAQNRERERIIERIRTAV